MCLPCHVTVTYMLKREITLACPNPSNRLQVQALTDRWIADVDRLRQTKDKELEAQH